MAVVAAFVCLGLGASAVPAAAATKPVALYHFHVHGVAKNGTKFSGTYYIQRYAVVKRHGTRHVFAVGALRGWLKNRPVRLNNVMMPAKLTGSGSSAQAAQATSCTVLHLVLGPIRLNLLGLVVTLGGGAAADQPIVLDITAVPGPGNLLGNLLCDLTNALGSGGALSTLSAELQQLAATLTSLTALLGAL